MPKKGLNSKRTKVKKPPKTENENGQAAAAVPGKKSDRRKKAFLARQNGNIAKKVANG